MEVPREKNASAEAQPEIVACHHHALGSQLHSTATRPKRSERLLRWLKSLEYIPKRCRWNPKSPPEFNWGMCFLFSYTAAWGVANLYYNHPILNVLADDFKVTFETASRVPTLLQAGYAAGLLLICPLGDILRRRPLCLFLVSATATIWLGLCLTTSFNVFLTLSFLVGFMTVTPQLMLPLVAELAPPKRRAMMISVVFSGLFLGVLVARILSGAVTQYTGWRTIYLISLGLQYSLAILLFLFLPDYPSINPEGVSYLKILWTIIRIPMRQPLLVQTSLIGFLVSASMIGFWTTVTFLLVSPPFNLSSLVVGLFAFVGMPPFLINPLLSQQVTDRYHPLYGCLFALFIALAGVIIGTFVSTFSLAGPVIMGFCVDVGLIMCQTANRMSLVAVEPKARNRVNTVYMVTVFCGMLAGTSVSNRLYALGGWHYSGAASISFIVAAIILCLARGPYETGWAGWSGGWAVKKEEQENTADQTHSPGTLDETTESEENAGERTEKSESSPA